MADKLFNFPDDFTKQEWLDSDRDNLKTVEEEQGDGPCGGHINAAAGYGEAVKDCKDVPEDVKKRIGDKAVEKLSSAIFSSCKHKGCKVGKLDKPYWRESCRRNHYAVVVACRYTCVK